MLEIRRHFAIVAPGAFRSGKPFDIVVHAFPPTEREEGWDEAEIEVAVSGAFLRFEPSRAPLRLRANQSSEPCVLTGRFTDAPPELKEASLVVSFWHGGSRYCGSRQKTLRINEE